MKSVKILWVFTGIILSAFIFMGCPNNNAQQSSEATEETEDIDESENEDEMLLDSLEYEEIDSSEYEMDDNQ